MKYEIKGRITNKSASARFGTNCTMAHLRIRKQALKIREYQCRVLARPSFKTLNDAFIMNQN